MSIKSALTAVIMLFSNSYLYCQNDEIVFVELCYASTTALPFSQNNVLNIMDGDPDTSWKSMRSSGPGEWILVTLKEPVFISSIDIQNGKQSDMAEIFEYEINIDSLSFAQGRGINRLVQTFQLKILKTDKTDPLENDINSIAKFGVQKVVFDDQFSIGLSSITIKNIAGAPYPIKVPNVVSGSITATSELTPNAAYGADNLMDMNIGIPWVEGLPGNGIGERITFKSDEPLDITHLKIWNGNQFSPDHYENDARLKTFRFGTSFTNLTQYTITHDQLTPQVIELEAPLRSTEFVLVIDNVYRGKENQNLGIGEILFLNEKESISIRSKGDEVRIKENLTLELGKNNRFDHRALRKTEMQQSMSDGQNSEKSFSGHIISCVVRSNGTFEQEISKTYWKKVKDANSGSVMADDYNLNKVGIKGFWEVLKATDQHIEIRFSGVKYFSQQTRDKDNNYLTERKFERFSKTNIINKADGAGFLCQ